MNVRTLLSIATIASVLAVPGYALAQDEHMISGKAVPADQVAEVQAKCDDLRKAEASAATPTPSADAASPSTPETPATPDSKPAAPAPDATASANSNLTEDGTKIDVTALTVAMCDEGNFPPSSM